MAQRLTDLSRALFLSLFTAFAATPSLITQRALSPHGCFFDGLSRAGSDFCKLQRIPLVHDRT